MTVAATRKLIERGAIPRDESIVICVTGNGYKTAEVMNGRGVEPIRIGRSLAEFEAIEHDDGGGLKVSTPIAIQKRALRDREEIWTRSGIAARVELGCACWARHR